jgi:hypothetical protein
MGVRVLIALSALGMLGATPGKPVQCQPVQPFKAEPGMAANSTYISSDEPPERFLRKMPSKYVKVVFGPEMVDKYCDPAPCDFVTRGCVTGDDLIVLPDPSEKDFAKIARHEIAHFNGWPASHGD